MSMYSCGVAKELKISYSPKALSSLAEQFKALGDETRLGLIMAVAASEGAEACVCDLTPDTGLAQSTVSHHLKILVSSSVLGGLLTLVLAAKILAFVSNGFRK